jgi:hypothetical protein
MIETAVADVASPPIAAQNPNALLHQRIRHRVQIARFGVVKAAQCDLQRRDALALFSNTWLGGLILFQNPLNQSRVQVRSKITQQFQRIEAAEIDEKPATDNVVRLADERKP